MKQLITATASIVLILALMIELVNIQLFYISILRADYEMYSFADTIRADGYISEENELRITERMSEILNCDHKDISVTGPDDCIPAGELVEVEVEATIRNIGNSWLIGKMRNSKYMYMREYFVVSTAL